MWNEWFPCCSGKGFPVLSVFFSVFPDRIHSLISIFNHCRLLCQITLFDLSDDKDSDCSRVYLGFLVLFDFWWFFYILFYFIYFYLLLLFSFGFRCFDLTTRLSMPLHAAGTFISFCFSMYVLIFPFFISSAVFPGS